MTPILFARRDSIYKTIAGTDVYDEDRNALTFQGPGGIVAHPPCRMWGRLYKFAKGIEAEKVLGLWAVDQVRAWRGVLEHPSHSKLWKAKGLPRPGEPADIFGGWTLAIDQYHFGHRTQKATWLYIVGLSPEELPTIPYRSGEPTHVVCNLSKRRMRDKGLKPHIRKAEREATPEPLAYWLVDVARRCRLPSVSRR